MYKVKNKEKLKEIIKQANSNDDLNHLDVSAITNMEDLEQLRNIPISRILGLPEKDRRFSIRCPFHADTDPSMVIYPDNSFHCFGCGAHGSNSIDFVMKSGCSFQEAIKELKEFI